MEEQEFAEQIWDVRQTLFRVCWAQLASAHDREDAIQETLVRAWHKRGQLRQTEYLQTWLIRILLNVCHDMQRRNRRIIPVEEAPVSAFEPSEGLDADLREALRALPEKFRMPVMLHYIEGYPIRQVAQMQRIPEGTVKTRLTRGKQQLKERLHEEVFAP